MTDQRHRVLILTDSDKHNGKESLFPMAAHLCQNPLIESVYVADRAEQQNDGFFDALDLTFNAFYAHKIDQNYDYNAHRTDTYPADFLTADDFDAVWVRIDHPVTNDFLTYMRVLLPDHFIVNDPDGLIKTMSKEFSAGLSEVLGDFMPAQKLCRTADDVEAFKAGCPDGIVLKQVLSYGGKGVVRYRDDAASSDLHSRDEVAAYLAEHGLCLAMEYLNPAEGQSDNRVLIINGHVLFVVKRIAAEGGWLCNVTSGATAVDAPVTEREIEIARRLDPIMRENGIFLYGADMLLNSQGERVLSEINTLNVGTIAISERLTGRPLTKFIADNLANIIHAGDVCIPLKGMETLDV